MSPNYEHAKAHVARQLALDPVAYRKKRSAIHKAWRDKNIDRERARCRAFPNENKLLYGARHRARKLGLPCDIEKSDVIIPKTCPVLGIPLVAGGGQPSPNSPTIDRVIPELGYTKGNVVVMSYRANTLKNNATLAEIELLASWLRARLHQ